MKNGMEALPERKLAEDASAGAEVEEVEAAAEAATDREVVDDGAVLVGSVGVNASPKSPSFTEPYKNRIKNPHDSTTLSYVREWLEEECQSK